MAISEDSVALVAAQLTVAWAHRMGEAHAGNAGGIGPDLVSTYRAFVKELAPEDDRIGEWIAELKGA